MILRKVTLSNWRALEKWEATLEAGLNVLQGRNEAGKSSVVEAIDWGLYRDITGARLRAEEVRVLIPATDPTARPSVEMDIQFPDCRATLLKVLAEDAGKRECRLTIRREGQADQYFDRTEAQSRLRALFAADGLGAEKTGVADGGLLVAHQNEGVNFLSDGRAAIRSTLGVGDDGQLALTARLDRARVVLEALRRKELQQDLEDNAIEAARAGTEAAKARELWREHRTQLAHFEAVEGEIEALRAQIEEVEAKLGAIVPEEEASKKRVEEFGVLLVAQGETDRAIAQAQNVEREARGELQVAKNRVEEIARLQHLQNEAKRELEKCQTSLQDAQTALETAQAECEKVAAERDSLQHEAEDAQHCVEAWRHYVAVFEAQAALVNERKALESLENLGQDLRDKQQKRDGAPKAPTFETLRAWQAAFDRMTALENEANQGIQLEIRAQNEVQLVWKSDGGASQKMALGEGENAALNAQGEGVLKIAGVGAIRVRSGARGAQELKDELEAARTQLGELLAEWKVEASALPDAIERWQAKREAFEAVENEWKEAVQALKNEENRVGSLHEAQKRVAERQEEFVVAKEAVKPFDGVLNLGGKKRSEVKTAFEEADALAKNLSARANRARNEAATLAQKLREAESQFHAIKARPDALNAAMESRQNELNRLENDGLSPEARTAHLDEWNQKLARARLELESTTAARRELGDSVSQWKLEDARRAAATLSERRDALEKQLVAQRRDLFHACEQDATAEIERLKVILEDETAQVAAHEARLRGLALLDGAIQAERARLSRDLAGPLNEKLGPWLSKLRGKNTQLCFDEAGSRIESVLTGDGQNTISLPFSEHSEGMKEQVAFALRLLLATRIAAHLPSKRLPVVLDDPFTQSDTARRGGLGEVLNDACENLQILFVTCHEVPRVNDLPIHLIHLGEWDEEAREAETSREAKLPQPKSGRKAEKVEKKPAKKVEKVVAQQVESDRETLSLF